MPGGVGNLLRVRRSRAGLRRILREAVFTERRRRRTRCASAGIGRLRLASRHDGSSSTPRCADHDTVKPLGEYE